NEDVSPGLEINSQALRLRGVNFADLVDRLQLRGFLIECAVRLSGQFVEWGVRLEHQHLVRFLGALVLDVERYLPDSGRCLLGNNRILLSRLFDVLNGPGTGRFS